MTMLFAQARSMRTSGGVASSARSSAARPAAGLSYATGRQQQRMASHVALAAIAARGDAPLHIQLATAKIPGAVSVPAFAECMYQWAATLTQSGQNFPFACPIKADRLDTGFQISLLKKSGEGFDSAGDLQATVEAVEGKGNVLFVRFYEGPASFLERRTPAPADDKQRLDIALQSLVDVPIILSTMPDAIRSAVKQSATA